MPGNAARQVLEDFKEEGDGFEALLLQMAALGAIAEANREEGPVDRARYLARQAWEVLGTPVSFEQHAVQAALAHVLQEPLSMTLPSLSTTPSWTVHVYESITLAWLRWLVLGDKGAVGITERLRLQEPGKGREPFGAMELGALTLWSQAVEKLALEDTDCARRFFERAIEVGSQIGSDSNPTVNWSYAASFFPR